MDFVNTTNTLINLFENSNFLIDAKNKRFNINSKEVFRCNDSILVISYPGKKTRFSSNGKTIVAHDYRVMLVKYGRTFVLSHVNIIIDIYNKIVNCGMPAENLRKAIIDAIQEGVLDLNKVKMMLPYTPKPPPEELLLIAEMAHGGKIFPAKGNSFNLTLQELFVCIKYIVLQEDINYPISQNKQGRKMPAARYLETIFVTQNDSHTLDEVIRRALDYSVPSNWIEMDYSFLDLIN